MSGVIDGRGLCPVCAGSSDSEVWSDASGRHEEFPCVGCDGAGTFSGYLAEQRWMVANGQVMGADSQDEEKAPPRLVSEAAPVCSPQNGGDISYVADYIKELSEKCFEGAMNARSDEIARELFGIGIEAEQV